MKSKQLITYFSLTVVLALSVSCSSSDQGAIDKAVSATLAAAQPVTAAPTATFQPVTAAPTATFQPATAAPTATYQPATAAPTATYPPASAAPTASFQPATSATTASFQPATAAPTATFQPATATPTATSTPEPLPTYTPAPEPTAINALAPTPEPIATSVPTPAPAPVITSTVSVSYEVTEVDIDELVVLAKQNILAADQYKGKLVSADGIVVRVDEDEIFVAGIASGGYAIAAYGLDSFGSINTGFTCHYSAVDRDKSVELRRGDLITITGNFDGWYGLTVLMNPKANLEKCQFIKTSSERDYEGCLGLALLSTKLVPEVTNGILSLYLSGNDEDCNNQIEAFNKSKASPNQSWIWKTPTSVP